MKYDLREIFRAITPDNIKDTPVIRDSMDIFIDTLKERSQQSIDISTYTKNKKIRNELFKTYLGDLYEVLDGIKDNQKIIDLIAKRNELYDDIEDYEFISREVLEEMLERINDEHFMAFRTFREKKGTLKGIEYIFHLIATLVNAPEGIDYIIVEGENPFELNIEGTLPPEFYYFLIAPLAHPAGFTYAYAQAVVLELVDYFFPVQITYTVRQLEANCITYDPITGNEIRSTHDFSSWEVINIQEETFTWPRSTRIYFGGSRQGQYLENLVQSNGQSTVELKDSDDVVIQTYGDFCTLIRVIQEHVSSDSDFDKIVASLEYPYERSNYNSFYDPNTGEVQEFEESVVQDVFAFLDGLSNDKNPYLSWEFLPFWSVIGTDKHKYDNWIGRCLPDSLNNPTISQLSEFGGSGRGLFDNSDNVQNLIGSDHMYIWGKLESTEPQYVNETIDSPERYNPLESGVIPEPGKETILYGLTEFDNTEALLINPSNPDIEKAWISGDAYHLHYLHEPVDINPFDTPVVVNGFDVRDNEYSYVIGIEDVVRCSYIPEAKFWSQGFHSKSDIFEFGVFRNGKYLPDNNINNPVIENLLELYAESYDSLNEFHIVFDENSDFLGDILYKFNNTDDYSKLLEDGTIAFDENSDHMGTVLRTPLNEDYSVSYESGNFVTVFDEYSDYSEYGLYSDETTEQYKLSYETNYQIGIFTINGDALDSDDLEDVIKIDGILIGERIDAKIGVFGQDSDDHLNIESD